MCVGGGGGDEFECALCLVDGGLGFAIGFIDWFGQWVCVFVLLYNIIN